MAIRICYAIKLETGGLWGSAREALEAHVVTSTCRHPGLGKDAPCIPNTYIKGLLRRSLERIAEHLVRLKIVDIAKDGEVVNMLFGPLTLFEGAVDTVARGTIVPPLFMVKDPQSVEALSQQKPLSYIYTPSDHIVVEDSAAIYIEPHVRIDDVLNRASTGALYSEERIAPRAVFYGELIHYPDDQSLTLSLARALVLAIGALKLGYIGRKVTVGIPYIASIEPRHLAQDPIISQVMHLLSKGFTR